MSRDFAVMDISQATRNWNENEIKILVRYLLIFSPLNGVYKLIMLLGIS